MHLHKNPCIQKMRRKSQKKRRSSRPSSAVWLKSVVVDMCARSITVPSTRNFSSLTRVLGGMGIHYTLYDSRHALCKRSVQIRSEEELRFFLLLLPDGQVLYDNLPSCPPPQPCPVVKGPDCPACPPCSIVGGGGGGGTTASDFNLDALMKFAKDQNKQLTNIKNEIKTIEQINGILNSMPKIDIDANRKRLQQLKH